ncbi:HalOD1 output domain-containing protein [Halorussus litoreus]|uniref:HalOD1 output domain-containing protein n=1 Tax=Halorussus litoreus TaxID=1710536 RepID=UPI000E27331F
MTDESRPADEPTAPLHGRYLSRWGDETPLYEAVTDAVSTVTGDARSAVASRYDRAHAFALSQLFGGDDEPSTPSTGVVKFPISECVVSVHSDGRLSVSPADRGRNAID